MAGGTRGKIQSPLLRELADAPEVAEDDYSLINRFRDGDRQAGHLLFVKHHKMILKVVIDVTNGRWYDDDCLNAGAVGLYEAAKRFDTTLGYTFLTYAVPWIRKYVHIEVCNDALPAGGIAFGRDFKERLYRFIGYKMVGKTEEEIATLMKISVNDVRRLASAATSTSRPVSLNNIRNEEEEEGADYELNGMPTERSAEDHFLDDELKRVVEETVDEMDEDSQFILNHTLCVNNADYMERKELIRHFNVQAPEFTRLKREAYRKLKQALIRRRAVNNDVQRWY